jgi:hypothetical protein
MSAETELETMAFALRARGFHVVYPQVHGSLLVAARPEDSNGIRVYRRGVHITRRIDSWSTFVGGIERDEHSTAEEVQTFVCGLMEGSDEDYGKECERRRAIVVAAHKRLVLRHRSDHRVQWMPFNLAERLISAAEEKLGAPLPHYYRQAIWNLHPILDNSDRKRLSRSCNDIVRENRVMRDWPGTR